jgi:phenylalanyl-tRNA synthetase beta chain
MPTIAFTLDDLNKLVGKNLTIPEITSLLEYGKGELESYDEETDTITISLDDTNLPYLWSPEGIARLFKNVLGLQKGIPKIDVYDSDYSVIVDKSVHKIRPFIASFVAKGIPLTDYIIKQFVQIQEKLCENYGRRRQQVSIGLYNYKRIKFPIHYKAVHPDAVKFTPLEMTEELTLRQILKKHPTGREYAWIIEDFDRYPILMDDKNEVLSLPPIINSNTLGKIEIGDTDLFFEVTGTNEESVNLAAVIYAYALHDRGFKIYSAKIKYPTRSFNAPVISEDNMEITPAVFERLIGISIKEPELKKLLEKAGYDFSKNKATIPAYRQDILHPFDIVEDAAIMYGYDKMQGLPMKSYTIGKLNPITRFVDLCRELSIGFGYQEVFGHVLSNKNLLYEKMNMKDTGTVEIEKYMSETYSVMRTWLIPGLMEVLSKNTNVSYPQKIFEQGAVAVRKGDSISEYERIAFTSCYQDANFTEMKQLLDAFMKLLGIKYEIHEAEHDSFIKGRVGRIMMNNKGVGYIGEIHPLVLDNFNLSLPVAGLELNLSEIFEIIK